MNINDTLKDWLPGLKKEAELGNPDAMGILAAMYRDGNGVEKDDKLAQHYAKMESNAPPFDLPDDDDTNPWLQRNSIEV